MPEIDMRRVAKFHIDMRRIASLLHLPEGVTPVFMYGTSDPSGVWVVVQSDDFPEAPPDCEAPPLTLGIHAEMAEIDGKTYVREWIVAQTAKELADLLPSYAWAVAE